MFLEKQDYCVCIWYEVEKICIFYALIFFESETTYFPGSSLVIYHIKNNIIIKIEKVIYNKL